MKWSTFFRLRPSLIFVAGFGFLAFILGLTYSRLSEESAKLQKSTDWSSLIPPAVTLTFMFASLKVVQDTVSKEIEVETKAQLDEKEKGIIDHCLEEYSKNLESLKDDIFSLEIPSESREIISEKFIQLELAKIRIEADFESFKDLVKWLDEKDNKILLLNTALGAVSQFNISEKFMVAFDKDMRECINWLRHSIDNHVACKVEPGRYASAMLAGMPGGAEPYEVALKAIKEKPKFREILTKTPFVEEMIDYLTKEISQQAKQETTSAA
jgi:hypothetical protein